MTTFDRREEAFENLFAHDEEMRFRAEMRRARLVAIWAAGLIGKPDVEAEAYAGAIVSFAIAQGGEQALFERIAGDLRAAGDTTSPAQLRQTMDRILAEAIHHVRTV